MNLRHPIRLLLALSILSILTACSTLNSQLLDLHPQIDVKRKLPPDTRVDIISRDLRKTPVIGFRHTDKKPAPEIHLKDSVDLLHHTTEHALEDMGVSRFYPGEFLLEISLIDLTYKVEKSTLKQKVILYMELRVKVSKGKKSYSGSYSGNKEHIYVKTPSEEENEKAINELVQSTMSNALNDPQLLDFLDFN